MQSQCTLFIVILTYTVSLDAIDAVKPAHVNFLKTYYDQNIFITSGPLNPRTGGVIIAQCASKNVLEDILKKDPFIHNALATYEIIEFFTTMYQEDFMTLLKRSQNQ